MHETRPRDNRCGFPRAMFSPMNRLVVPFALGAMVATAAAQPVKTPTAAPAAKKPAPVTATLPAVGELVTVMGGPTWPAKLDWLYDVPSAKDAAGKVVIHWFCAAKVKVCADDLARIITLKENGRRLRGRAHQRHQARCPEARSDPRERRRRAGLGLVRQGHDHADEADRPGRSGLDRRRSRRQGRRWSPPARVRPSSTRATRRSTSWSRRSRNTSRPRRRARRPSSRARSSSSR